MNARRVATGIPGRIVLGLLPLALLALPLHADTRMLYGLSSSPGLDTLPTLGSFTDRESLRPGFRNDIQPGRAVNLEIRSTRLPSVTSSGLDTYALETSGRFIQRFGSRGFGYGVGVGVDLRSADSAAGVLDRHGLSGAHNNFVLTGLSTGPTYEAGNLRSQVRIGVRYPLLADGDTDTPLYRHRGDTPRSAGYLSLDSQLRFSNQTNMAFSLFYDDYRIGASQDWLSGRLDFQNSPASSESVIGLEMGLNF
jgi:hypothetical protein